MADDCCFESR